MKQNYEFVEDEYEEGITFKKVMHFFKKGWLRAVIYVAACLLVALIVALPIRTFYKSEPTAQTTVEFVYDGIEDGLAPDGSILSADNIITTKIVSEAVARSELGEKITDISALRRNMRVEGEETAEYAALAEAAAGGNAEAAATLRTYVMHPTSFNIIISDPQSLGLSDADAKKLLNNVVNCYYSDFLNRFSVQNMFSSNVFTLSANKNVEFANILDIYDNALTSIRATLTELAAENPNFISRENNTSFATLVSEFVVLENRYELLDGYISTNNIWLDKIAARDALVVQQAEISGKLKPLQDYIVALNEQIALINREYSIAVDGDKQQVIIGQYPEIYTEYHLKLDAANSQVREYQTQLANIDMRLNKLGDDNEPTPSAFITEAQNRLSALEKDTVEKIEHANSTINDYYYTQYLASSVRQTRQPIVVRIGLSFSILLVLLVAGVAGLLAAFAVTGVKISLANNARSKKAASAEDSAAPVADKKTDDKE